jgi:DNA-binding transcriptional ArsR family regulator
MIRAELDGPSLGKVRLAPSPALEATCWLRLTRNRGTHQLFGDPGPAARWSLRDPDVALVAQVLPGGSDGYVPDLLTPKPAASPLQSSFAAQLDVIEQTPDDELDLQLRTRFAREPMPAAVRHAMGRGDLSRRMASGLQKFWRCCMVDGWPQLLTILNADARRRAMSVAEHGVGTMLNNLHPTIAWTGTEVAVDLPWHERIAYHDAELVLVPTALGWPQVSVQLCDSTNAVLAYPAGGIGQRAVVAGGSASVLGATRAAILTALAVPRTTTELSGLLNLAASTVSYHLDLLYKNRLVHRTREGRAVYYTRAERSRSFVEDTDAATT